MRIPNSPKDGSDFNRWAANHLMKHLAPLFALFAAAAFVGCSTTSSHRDFSGVPATDIAVTITCSDPDMRFSGTICSDGRSQKYSGMGSGAYHTSGHEVICSFKKLGSNGRITLSAAEMGQQPGGSSTTNKFGGVRAEFLRLPNEQRTIFTTF